MALSDSVLIRLLERSADSTRVTLRSAQVDALVEECLAYRRLLEVLSDIADGAKEGETRSMTADEWVGLVRDLVRSEAV